MFPFSRRDIVLPSGGDGARRADEGRASAPCVVGRTLTPTHLPLGEGLEAFSRRLGARSAPS
ncbi:hypothetical protein EX530_16180 [Xanthomonas phaseoli]